MLLFFADNPFDNVLADAAKLRNAQQRSSNIAVAMDKIHLRENADKEFNKLLNCYKGRADKIMEYQYKYDTLLSILEEKAQDSLDVFKQGINHLIDSIKDKINARTYTTSYLTNLIKKRTYASNLFDRLSTLYGGHVQKGDIVLDEILKEMAKASEKETFFDEMVKSPEKFKSIANLIAKSYEHDAVKRNGIVKEYGNLDKERLAMLANAQNGFDFVGNMYRNKSSSYAEYSGSLYKKINGDEVEIACIFAGSKSWLDWVSKNANIFKEAGNPNTLVNIKTHAGFMSAFNESYDDFFDLMQKTFTGDELKGKKIKITLGGHSLGGTMAQIAANSMYNHLERYKKANSIGDFSIGVLAFGAPGGLADEAVEDFDKLIGKENVLLFENVGDMVTGIPVVELFHKKPKAVTISTSNNSFLGNWNFFPLLGDQAHSVKNYVYEGERKFSTYTEQLRALYEQRENLTDRTNRNNFLKAIHMVQYMKQEIEKIDAAQNAGWTGSYIGVRNWLNPAALNKKNILEKEVEKAMNYLKRKAESLQKAEKLGKEVESLQPQSRGVFGNLFGSKKTTDKPLKASVPEATSVPAETSILERIFAA